MIEHIFSNSFRETLKSKKIRDIINIDPDLRELLVAAIGSLLDEHLIWLVGENENFIEKEKKLQSWLKLLGKDDVSICYFKLPFEDPYVNNHFDLSALSNKIKLLLELLRQKRLIVISTMAALSIKIEERSRLKNFSLSLRVGDRIDRNQFLSRLIDMGYQSRDFVDQKGDLSWRGSIVDVFLVSEENPVRIEFWGGEAKSIRFFDFQTQKSIRNINEVLISVASYFLSYCTLEAYFSGNQENMAYITDLLRNVRIISSDFKKISHEYITLLNNFSRIRSLSRERKKPAKKVSEIFNFQLDRNKVMISSDVFDEVKSKAEIAKIKKSILEFNQSDIKNIERKIKKEGYHCFVGSENEKIIENLKIFWGDFQTFHFNFPFSFQNKKNRTLFLTFKNFDSQMREYKFENETIKTDHLLNRIKSNDFVVHKQHGIGKFLGIRKLEFDSIVSEFLQIEYQHKEFLYVPVYELDVLSKYVAFEGYYPRIDKLGGKTWQTKQSRAKKSMVVFARDLLELYAMRRSIKGYVYLGDYDMESKLQQGFRYVETKDQKGALRDVMRDLESETPMDRLVCGDVSFGKTEVVIRAAFRVILGGGQVVILCPTTILAWQHHETFKKRFSDFPVRVGLLSRMVPMNKKRSIYQNLENGKIDVVIGTHSLISGEIKFKNLGLVIIDEEQRFGVFQKEKLKKNREDIDVLSLSATPIPRTLSLALSGLQDLSIIQSPPIGRLAVKNYVGYFSKEIVLSAILNEMERDGLVFIVYNSIDKIYSFKGRLQTWLPDVKMT
ncbi:MAG: DEAD/DEAH box helicase, partial [Candidatus Aminicenantes bacterium]|nr:DEAD/DEAH box helicase [Candidatus Aminicenantes bacterium]